MTLSVALRHRFGDFGLDVAFETGPGVTALFGRSGAGKTTIVNAVAGLLRPDHAQIMLDGQRFDTLPVHKRRVGYVFQDARLFPHMTVAENLDYASRYGARASDRPRIIEMLGIGALLDRRPATLSGGEKQRVALGRALLSNPRLLLMDEPLAALDAPRKADILPYLDRLKAETGVPILYVSHAVDEVARLADHMVLLAGGRVARQGPIFDVMADPAAVPLLGVREAGAVLRARVAAHGEDGLSTLQLSAGSVQLMGVQAQVGSMVRLRVLAQDVLLVAFATRRIECAKHSACDHQNHSCRRWPRGGDRFGCGRRCTACTGHGTGSADHGAARGAVCIRGDQGDVSRAICHFGRRYLSARTSLRSRSTMASCG